MERLRELRFAPLWVIALGVGAALFGFAALTGFSYFGVLLAASCTPAFTMGIAGERRRYGGLEQMRQFYDALYFRQLPVLATAEDAIRWHRLIINERTRRRAASAMSWFYVVLAVLCLILPVLVAVADPDNALGGGLGMPAVGVIVIAAVAWVRFATPRVLAALDALAQQGTERGYGYWLTAGWPSRF
ncbi:hypothetical protein AB0N05_11290 [Nocardia sp. NPDC051030]|uniref:hypothetical protein n=1 Tax=Nocardia sp. NPDC051030 TaxID=3155162 RepID=UPI003443DA96